MEDETIDENRRSASEGGRGSYNEDNWNMEENRNSFTEDNGKSLGDDNRRTFGVENRNTLGENRKTFGDNNKKSVMVDDGRKTGQDNNRSRSFILEDRKSLGVDDSRKSADTTTLSIDEEETDGNKNEETTTVGGLTTTMGYLPPNQLEQTLAVVKPDAILKAEEIITIIHREGFTVLQARRVKLTAEQAASFYQDKYDTPWFSGSVENLSSGQCLAMVLSGPGAVRHWYNLVGPQTWEERSKLPKCLGFQYGVKENDPKNAVHGSATSEDALRELHFFFPELIVEPTIATNLASHYLNQNVHPVLTVGLSKLVRERPDDPVIWLADWLLANNPNKPKESDTIQANPQTAGKCK